MRGNSQLLFIVLLAATVGSWLASPALGADLVSVAVGSVDPYDKAAQAVVVQVGIPQPTFGADSEAAPAWTVEDAAAYLHEVAAYMSSPAGEQEIAGLVAAGVADTFSPSLLQPAPSTRLRDLRPDQVMLIHLRVEGPLTSARIRLTAGPGLRLVRLTPEGQLVPLGSSYLVDVASYLESAASGPLLVQRLPQTEPGPEAAPVEEGAAMAAPINIVVSPCYDEVIWGRSKPPPPCCDPGTLDPCCGNPDPCCDDSDPCCDDPNPCCGVDCDDHNPCTRDGCAGGHCYHSPKNCDDGDPCTEDSCVGGNCVHTPKVCNDGLPCTDDFCVGGRCLHTPRDCDDGNPCTDDGCDPVTAHRVRVSRRGRKRVPSSSTDAPQYS